MVDTYRYGYAFDGWVACAECVSPDPDGPYTHEDGGRVYHDGSHDHGPECDTGYCQRAEGYPLWSHEDDGYGVTCDDCGDVIFEVWPEVAHREYGDHETLEDWKQWYDECDECRTYLEDHASHPLGYRPDAFSDHCYDCADREHRLRDAHANGDHSITTGQPDSNCPACPEAWFQS